MNKSEIAGSYMEEMKALHASKPLRIGVRRIAITGAGNEDSIGNDIAKLLAKEHKVSRMTQDVRSDPFDFDGIDTLIMSHGVMKLDWLEEISEAKEKEILDVNLFGSMRLVAKFVRATIDAPYRKKIVSIGSMAYRSVLNGSAAYCASKAGLAHYIRCAAWELAPKGFDVYCVHPSNVAGASMSEETIRELERFRGISREEAEAYWSASLPRDSFLTKPEISEVVKFLIGPSAGYLSGTQIDLTGGQR